MPVNYERSLQMAGYIGMGVIGSSVVVVTRLFFHGGNVYAMIYTIRPEAQAWSDRHLQSKHRQQNSPYRKSDNETECK